MKRYLVFTGDTRYPLGGWDDLVRTCDEFTEAVRFARSCHRDWAQVVDASSGRGVRIERAPSGARYLSFLATAEAEARSEA